MKPGLTSAVQESLVSLLCFDPTSGTTAAIPSPKAFDPFYRELVEAASAYRDRYKKPPGEHTLDLVDEIKARRPDDAEIFDRLYQSLLAVKDGLNRDYVLASAGQFVRRQRLKAAVTQSIKLLQRNEDAALDEAEALLAGAGKAATSELTTGLLFNDPTQALRFLNREETDTLRLGIPQLDHLGIGPARKKYFLAEAGTSVGKSWLAVHLGKMALLQGWRVAHITLEMSEDEVSQRYVQAICSVGKREALSYVRFFKKDTLGRFVAFEEQELKRPHFGQDQIARKLRKQLEPMLRRQPLYIKEFPSGSLTIRRLKAYLDMLEGTKNFLPDCLLVDYPDLMEHDPKHKRAELGKITVDLRGIAGERNIAVCGFSQVNETKQGKVIRTGRAFEDRSKEHTADIVLTLNQTDAEYDLGLLRLFVAKSRGEVKHLQVLISQALGIGQFCLDSASMTGTNYWSLVNAGSGEAEET